MTPPEVVTYCDTRYLAGCLVMLRSLRTVSPQARVTVLCLDAGVGIALRRLEPGVELVEPSTLERFRPELVEAVAGRSTWERYATLKPALVGWALTRRAEGDLVAYVDADLDFHADTGALVDALGPGSVGITPHRFPSSLGHMRVYGRFNAGFGLFRNDDDGRRCVERWTGQCIEMCSEWARGRFMNQSYLDAWPESPGVVVLNHPGANLAPWNVGSHRIEEAGASVTVDGQPLLFFHFSQLRRDPDGRWRMRLIDEAQRLPALIRRVYVPHVAALERAAEDVQSALGTDGIGMARWQNPARRRFDLITGRPMSASRALLMWLGLFSAR